MVIISFALSEIDINQLYNLKKLKITLIFIFLLIANLYLIKKFINQEKNLKSKIFNFLLFNFLIWSLQFFQIFLIISILNIDINIFETVFIFGISIIIGLIPISIGGFGVRDYVIYFLFTNLNIEANIFMLLILFNLRYLLPVLISFIFSIIKFKNE